MSAVTHVVEKKSSGLSLKVQLRLHCIVCHLVGNHDSGECHLKSGPKSTTTYIVNFKSILPRTLSAMVRFYTKKLEQSYPIKLLPTGYAMLKSAHICSCGGWPLCQLHGCGGQGSCAVSQHTRGMPLFRGQMRDHGHPLRMLFHAWSPCHDLQPNIGIVKRGRLYTRSLQT